MTTTPQKRVNDSRSRSNSVYYNPYDQVYVKPTTNEVKIPKLPAGLVLEKDKLTNHNVKDPLNVVPPQNTYSRYSFSHEADEIYIGCVLFVLGSLFFVGLVFGGIFISQSLMIVAGVILGISFNGIAVLFFYKHKVKKVFIDFNENKVCFLSEYFPKSIWRNPKDEPATAKNCFYAEDLSERIELINTGRKSESGVPILEVRLNLIPLCLEKEEMTFDEQVSLELMNTLPSSVSNNKKSNSADDDPEKEKKEEPVKPDWIPLLTSTLTGYQAVPLALKVWTDFLHWQGISLDVNALVVASQLRDGSTNMNNNNNDFSVLFAHDYQTQNSTTNSGSNTRRTTPRRFERRSAGNTSRSNNNNYNNTNNLQDHPSTTRDDVVVIDVWEEIDKETEEEKLRHAKLMETFLEDAEKLLDSCHQEASSAVNNNNDQQAVIKKPNALAVVNPFAEIRSEDDDEISHL